MLLKIPHPLFFQLVCSEHHQVVVGSWLLAQSSLEDVNECSGILIKIFVACCALDIFLQCIP